ncbi:MAG: efflux RND transporter periplasmic adaptor subunit [Planctomycetes bacterium]|nr:efflux RND transporter periplasmic adaptor subunit [Planctomycetota bacterium]
MSEIENKKSTKKNLKPIHLPIWLLLLIGALIGWGLHPNQQQVPTETELASAADGQEDAAAAEPSVWTCSMHPTVMLPEFGLCPICNMDLIELVPNSGGATGPSELKMSATAVALAEISTTPVQRMEVTHEVSMVGKIAYDQTKMAAIPAWFAGRIDQIFVDSTYIPVKKGDHLVALYSQDLYAAERDFLEARDGNARLASAARGRLRLMGVSEEQIKQLEKNGKPNEREIVYATIDGFVVHKNAMLGRYVKEGEVLYQIANLDQVWLELDAYETDLPWLRYGQKVEFDVLGWPGEIFGGRVSLISPVLHEHTRTIHLRVQVDNADGKLRPGMVVKARLHAQLSNSGRAMDPDLEGSWICPMHPEVIVEVAGACPKCGMDLIPASEMGSTDSFYEDDPLVIPVTAPLITGKRAVVYVRLPGEEPHFQGRQIVLGPRAGDWFVVNEGLREGELVVDKGAFRLDAELQLTGKVSMMSPEGGGSGGHNHGGMPGDASMAEMMPHEMSWDRLPANAAFQTQLGALAKAYVGIQVGLAGDDLLAAQSAAKNTIAALDLMPHDGVEGDAHKMWMELEEQVRLPLEEMIATDQMDAARAFFLPLSSIMIETVQRFGTAGAGELKLAFCPMADDDNGADWLQFGDDIRNPYFGSEMLMCGEVIRTLSEEK